MKKYLYMTFSTLVLLAGCQKDDVVAVMSVSIDATSITLDIEETQMLTATILPADADNQNAKWTITGDAATVDEDGLVTAIKAGSAIVTVTTEDGKKTDSRNVTVNPEPNILPEIEENYFSISNGIYVENDLPSATSESATLSSIVVEDSEVASDAPVVSVESNVALKKIFVGVKDTQGYFEVDATAALVTRASAFRYSFTIALSDHVEDTFMMTVSASTTDDVIVPATSVRAGKSNDPALVSVEGISVTPTEITMKVGDATVVSATITPINAYNKVVSYVSNDESVATVNDTGNVTAIGDGSATVTVTTEDGDFEASCVITVEAADPVAVTGITLEPAGVALETGDVKTMTWTILPENATNKTVTWSSSDEDVATVVDGVLTALSVGTTVVTVTTEDGTKMDTCDVTVREVTTAPEVDVLTQIPDAAFLAYVESMMDEWDVNEDGILSQEEAAAVTEMYVEAKGIGSLAGIGHFTGLTTLSCHGNQLVSLNVSRNTALTHLYCEMNQLTSLDVTNNHSLVWLGAGGNQLTSIDVSKNPELIQLDVMMNQLKSLNVSKNTAMQVLYARDNSLTTLDVSNNTALVQFDCARNQLTSMNISNNKALELFACNDNPGDGVSKFPVTAWFDNDNVPSDLFSMYEWTYDGVTIAPYYTNSTAPVEPTFNVLDNISDAVFAEYCEQFDTNGDGVLSQEETAVVTEIDVDNKGLSSLAGIEYFTGLTVLYADSNELTSLDVSNNTALEELTFEENNIRSIDLSNNAALWFLSCRFNGMTSLDVSNNVALKVLFTDGNFQLGSLNVSNNPALIRLYCGGSGLSSIDVSNNPLLQDFMCQMNELASLDLSNNAALEILQCGGNKLTSLNISSNTALWQLDCSDNELSSLDISKNTALKRLTATGNPGDGESVFPVTAWFDNENVPSNFTKTYILAGTTYSVVYTTVN